MDQFSVQLLGGFEVRLNDRRIDMPPACRRLVAIVALKRRPVHRLWVCASLWPHVHTRRAEASLRSALWRLRPVGAGPLVTVGPQYLQLSPDVAVDWHRATDLIEDLLRDGADAQLACDLLPLLRAGDLLDTWAERWVTGDRDRYHVMRTTALAAISHGSCAERSMP